MEVETEIYFFCEWTPADERNFSIRYSMPNYEEPMWYIQISLYFFRFGLENR